MSYERYLVKTFDEQLKALRVAPFGSLLAGIEFDKVEASYPTSTEEIYTYTLNGITRVQIKITYSNASKSVFLSAERV